MPEYVYMKAPCGFCMTQHHHNCKPTIEWNSKIYICGCQKCGHEHIPSVAVDKPSSDAVSFEEPKESIGEKDGSPQGQTREDEEL